MPVSSARRDQARYPAIIRAVSRSPARASAGDAPTTSSWTSAIAATTTEGRRGIVVIEGLRGDVAQAGLRVEREVPLAGGRAGALVLRP